MTIPLNRKEVLVAVLVKKRLLSPSSGSFLYLLSMRMVYRHAIGMNFWSPCIPGCRVFPDPIPNCLVLPDPIVGYRGLPTPCRSV